MSMGYICFCPHPQPLSCRAGKGCRGARRCALQRVPPLLRGGRGRLWSAEAKLPPALKLTLQHSKGLGAGLGVRATTRTRRAGRYKPFR